MGLTTASTPLRSTKTSPQQHSFLDDILPSLVKSGITITKYQNSPWVEFPVQHVGIQNKFYP